MRIYAFLIVILLFSGCIREDAPTHHANQSTLLNVSSTTHMTLPETTVPAPSSSTTTSTSTSIAWVSTTLAEDTSSSATTLPQSTECADIADRNLHDECVLESAVSTLKPSLCGDILQVRIRDTCYLQIMHLANDTGLCASITLEDISDACYSDSALIKADIELCRKIDNPKVKDKCFYSVAERLIDPNPCIRVQDTTLKGRCFANLASVSGNASICRYAEGLYKDLCYDNSARKTLDSEACSLIEGKEKRYDCYFYVATALEDPDICWQIGYSDTRILCTAKASGRTGICSMIKDDEMLGECLS